MSVTLIPRAHFDRDALRVPLVSVDLNGQYWQETAPQENTVQQMQKLS